MDFPSREEARVYASLQAQDGSAPPVSAPAARPSTVSTPSSSPNHAPARESSALTLEEAGTSPSDNVRFRVDKPGYESDVFDRRSMRNLIRAGDIEERDRIRVDEAPAVPGVEVAFLKSFFALRKTSRIQPPTCCRTHTDRVAHFKCRESLRPLCEECSPEKKFGATIIRVCSHCGGTATELVSPLA